MEERVNKIIKRGDLEIEIYASVTKSNIKDLSNGEETNISVKINHRGLEKALGYFKWYSRYQGKEWYCTINLDPTTGQYNITNAFFPPSTIYSERGKEPAYPINIQKHVKEIAKMVAKKLQPYCLYGFVTGLLKDPNFLERTEARHRRISNIPLEDLFRPFNPPCASNK